MTKIAALPIVFRMDAVDKFLTNIIDTNSRPVDKHILIDFSKLNFIDGSGFTVLSNSIAWLKDQGSRVEIFSKPNNSEGMRYLDDCGFFVTHLKRRIFPGSKCRDTTLPCVSVSRAESFSWIENRLSPWLSWTLNVSPESLSSLRACMKEIFNNILDHSAKNTGFIHTQHYPNLHQVRITVSDFGVGIPYTISRRFGHMDDPAAIRFAAQEGVTAQSRPNNMGAGLNFLIDCITSNDGSVLIHSRRGQLFCVRRQGEQERIAKLTKGSYPGTLVELNIDTRLFQGDDDERGDLEW